MKHYLFLVVYFLFIGSLYADESRTWTSADGSKKIQATFVVYDETNDIIVIKNNDKEQRVKLSLFSESDRKWVKKHASTIDPFSESRANTNANEVNLPNEDITNLIKVLSDESDKLINNIRFDNAKTRAVADIALIRGLSGRKNDSIKYFNEAIKINAKRIIKNNRDEELFQRHDYRRIGKNAVKAGSEIAENIIQNLPQADDYIIDRIELLCELSILFHIEGKNDKSNNVAAEAMALTKNVDSAQKDRVLTILVGSFATMEQFDKAMSLTSEIEKPFNKAGAIVKIGREYLKYDKEKSALEMFDLAKGLDQSPSINISIVNAYIDAVLLDDIVNILNLHKVDDIYFSINRLCYSAIKAHISGNKVLAKGLLNEARKREESIQDDVQTQVRSLMAIENVLYIFNDRKGGEETYQRALKVAGLEKDAMKMVLDLFTIATHETIVREGDYLNKMFVDAESIVKNKKLAPQQLASFWRDVARGAVLFGNSNIENKCYECVQKEISKMENQQVKSKTQYLLDTQKKRISYWYETESAVQERLLPSFSNMLQQFVRARRIDDAIAMKNRIELPEAKIYALRVLVEELHDISNK